MAGIFLLHGLMTLSIVAVRKSTQKVWKRYWPPTQDVERVSVVGAPHDTLGQQTVACIVLMDQAARFTMAEIRDFLAEKGLAKFQYPDQLVFLPELPLTHSGKIKNKDLRQWLQVNKE